MHPPLTIMNRQCSEQIDFEGVKGKKYTIKKDASVNISVFSMHYDPEFYPDPNTFKPERFDAEHGGVKAFRDRCLLLPFGEGPRICLGMKFALMQSKAAIADIVRNYEITVNDNRSQAIH